MLKRFVRKKKHDNLFVFVHIPKTAGTSFRKALEKKHDVVCDYGVENSQTDKRIISDIYVEKIPLSFYHYIVSKGGWLAGHISLIKYLDVSLTSNFVTFVRSPVEQVWSHYKHLKKHQDLTLSFEDFVINKEYQNLQSKCLSGLPISLLGFVGITEYYKESIELFNYCYGYHLEELRENVNEGKADTSSDLSQSSVDLIKENNRKDIRFYEVAVAIYRQRILFSQKGENWVYGFAQRSTQKSVYGCAFNSGSDKAVSLKVYIDGIVYKEIIANQFFVGFPKAKFTRERYIGFHFVLPRDFSECDKLEIKVANTGQYIAIDAPN